MPGRSHKLPICFFWQFLGCLLEEALCLFHGQDLGVNAPHRSDVRAGLEPEGTNPLKPHTRGCDTHPLENGNNVVDFNLLLEEERLGALPLERLDRLDGERDKQESNHRKTHETSDDSHCLSPSPPQRGIDRFKELPLSWISTDHQLRPLYLLHTEVDTRTLVSRHT